MGGFFFKPPPKTPIKNPCIRLGNICINNFRGILGTIVPAIIFPVLFEKGKHDKTVQAMWLIMFWVLLLQPVSVPIGGLVPLFIMPIFCVSNSGSTCVCYFNSGMTLYIVGGYLTFLLNNSGADRRIMLRIMCPGKSGSITSMGLLVKASFAAFLTSMLSNRLIATSQLMQYVTEPLLALKTSKRNPGETSINFLRYLLANAIQTSASIGSITIMHSAFATLAFRTIYEMASSHSADVFNFLQYSLFALPTGIVLFVVNLIYNIVLLKISAKGEISASSVTAIRNSLTKSEETIPKSITLHEIMTILSLVVVLVTYCTRWNMIFKRLDMGYGWSEFRSTSGIPMILDATVATIFAVLLHVIPNSFNFMKFCGKLKQSQMPNKPESTILFWRYVDKNTNYGYILLIGSGVALNLAISVSGLGIKVVEFGKIITDNDFEIGLLMICFITIFMSNIMSSVAVVAVFLPFVMNMIPAKADWVQNSCLASLAVGVGSSFGFASPFRYTPAFFVKTVAKVPLLNQIKYSIGSSLLCTFILWVMTAFYAPIIFIEKSSKVETVVVPEATILRW